MSGAKGPWVLISTATDEVPVIWEAGMYPPPDMEWREATDDEYQRYLDYWNAYYESLGEEDA